MSTQIQESVSDSFPMSPQQKRLWLIGQRERFASGELYAVLQIDIAGEVCQKTLRQAMDEVVDGHEVLRTTFEMPDWLRVPEQVVHPEGEVAWEFEDVSGVGPGDQSLRLSEIVDQQRSRAAALDGRPCLAVALVTLDPQHYRLILTLRSLCADRWSLGLLASDLGRTYVSLNGASLTDGGSTADDVDAAEPLQYVDFSEWQLDLAESEDEAELLRAFWSRYELTALGVERLPGEQPGLKDVTFRPESVALAIDAETVAAIDVLEKRLRRSTEEILLAAFLGFLWRLSDRSDVAVGCLFDGRKFEDLQFGLGLYSRCLPVAPHAGNDPTFTELIDQVAGSLRESARWQQHGIPENPSEASDEALGFRLLFEFEDEVELLPGVGDPDVPKFSPLSFEATLESFKWKLSCRRSGDRLTADLRFDARIFARPDVERAAQQFSGLLARWLKEPQRRCGSLGLASPRENRQFLVDFNDTARDFDAEGFIQLFEQQVDSAPDKTALICEDRQLAYGDLDQRANRLAHRLLDLGVGPEVRVGILAGRSPEMILGLLGVLKAGGAYVPLDPTFPPKRLTGMLEDAAAAVLLLEVGLVGNGLDFDGPRLPLDAEEDEIEEVGSSPVLTRLDSRVSPGSLMYVLFTSGSTGRPKGVAVEHRQIANYLRAIVERFSWTEPMSYASVSTFAADLGNTMIFPALATGGCLHVVAQHRIGDAKALAEYLDRYRVDCLKIVPSHLTALLASPHGEQLLPRRGLVLGGEATQPSLLQQLRDLAPDSLSIWNHYGPTETTVGVTTRAFCLQGEPTHAEGDMTTAKVHLGRPLSNVQIYLLDRGMQPAVTEVAGEIHIGGANVARGYLGQPGQTAARFIPDSLSGASGARLYRSGDRARFDRDGEIEFLGRIDHQVKIRGFRIELGEIDAAIGRHPEVAEAVTRVHIAERDKPRLIVYVVPRGSEKITLEGMRGFVEPYLPEYMIPGVLVSLDRLPRTPNGKIDSQAFPDPESLAISEVATHVPPRNPIEDVVAGIWSELLGLDQVSIHNDFFQLGGHSLLATQAISRLRQAFGVEVTLAMLFAEPTVARLGQRISQQLSNAAGQAGPEFERVSRDRELPLSYAQQRLWFLHQLEPESPAYNVPTVLELEGALDIAALSSSFSEIVRRHESLRTIFAATAGKPVQTILPPVASVIPVIDLTGLPEAQRLEEARRFGWLEAQRPFDLATGPLVRLQLLHLKLGVHRLLLTMHHIVTDGWSNAVLVRELAALYRSFSVDRGCSAGRGGDLPDLAVQYADYAVWQREWLQGEVLEREVSYWRRRLAGAPAVLEFPSDRPRPAQQSYRGAVRSVSWPRAQVENLRALGRRQDATLFMVLLAAWQTLLMRMSGQQDISVGTPIAGRNYLELEGLVGFFVNTLIHRIEFNGNPTFGELLEQVRQVSLEDHTHQHVPFEKLVEELNPERSASYSPLFQVMFVFQNMPMEPVALSELTVRPLPVERDVTQFDLSLTWIEGEGDLYGSWEYSLDLFDVTTIARLERHLETLVQGILEHPQQRVDNLELLSVTEKFQLLTAWNGEQRTYPVDQTIHQLFEFQVMREPDRIAAVSGTQQVTYVGLDRRADCLAGVLGRASVRRGHFVGILKERDIDFLVAVLAILKVGGAYVPFEPSYPQDRLLNMVSDSGVATLVTDSQSIRGMQAVLNGAPELAHLIAFDSLELTLEREGSPLNIYGPEDLVLEASGSAAATVKRVSVGHARDPAYMLYTSGSTGAPKGAIVPHDGAVNHMYAEFEALDLDRELRFLQSAPSSSDISVWQFLAPLVLGGRTVIVDLETASDPEKLFGALRDERISLAELVPSVLRYLVEYLAARGRDERALPALQCLMAVGEPVPVGLVNAWLELYPEVLTTDSYGPTEASDDVTQLLIRQPLPPELPSIPIGRPLANYTCYLLDRRLRPVPIGVPGEICVGGIAVGQGYWRKPAKTTTSFVPDPFSRAPGGQPLYRTGDLGRWLADGTIELLGRIDHQVKIRGFRVELGEIESVLLGHEAVLECAVLAWEDGHDKQLVAYPVPRPGCDIPAQELRELVAQQLPTHMVPAAFVSMPSLPLTPAGKIDRRALPEPGPEDRRSDRLAPPRDDVEEQLAEIWADVLGVDQVGIHTSFFDLGGHSLLATQVLARLRKVFSVDLPLRRLFEGPTVADLAAAVRELGAGPSIPAIEPKSWDQGAPLSFAQQRLWFLHQLDPESTAYSLHGAVRLEGQLDIPVLTKALSEIVRRHQVLRSVFESGTSEAVQRVLPSAPMPLPCIDLRTLPAEVRDQRARQEAAAECERPFDLEAGPLIRCRLLMLEDCRYVLVVNMHHIVSDGWSIELLVQQLTVLYTAFLSSETSPLGELRIQYADFAHWQREWLGSDILASEITYWRQQLAGAPALLELPTDWPRPEKQAFRGAIASARLSPELNEPLLSVSRQQGATLFMTLLAGFQVLLARHSGQSDVSVGTPIAGRLHVELEALIGCFVNTLVLRSEMSEDPSFRQHLGEIRNTALGAYAHQQVPFEKLVEELEPERSLSYSPLFQVLLVMQNVPAKPMELPGLTMSHLDWLGASAQFDLTLILEETEDGLSQVVKYDRDLFEAATVQRLLSQLGTLLSSAVRNPNQRLSELPLMTAAEHAQLLAECAGPQIATPAATLSELFEARVQQSPRHIAASFRDQELSYFELNERANRLAWHLRALGVGPDAMVGLCLERSLDMLVAMLGILKAGGAYVPLDPSYPVHRQVTILEDSQASILVTSTTQAAALPTLSISALCVDRDGPEIARNSRQNLPLLATPANLAYVIYTSGSTGRPKGVMGSHGAITHRLSWMIRAFPFTDGDRLLHKTSYSFDASIWEIFVPWMVGATVVVAEPEGHQDLTYLLDTIAAHSVTILQLVPSLVPAFLEQPDLAERGRSLRWFFCGGEALPGETVRRFFRRLDCTLCNLYGPTENSIDATFEVCDPTRTTRAITPIGQSLENVTLCVLDSRGYHLPPGLAGELAIGGSGLARGYIGKPALSAERFIPETSSSGVSSPDGGGRLYRTGDLVRYNPTLRKFEFLGRIDHQVKLRGFRIELGEIEACLREQETVRDGVVILQQASDTGLSGGPSLVACVVPEAGIGDHEVLPQMLSRILAGRLPDYMIPTIFLVVDELPRLPNSKVDRAALDRRAKELAVSRRLEQATLPVAPRSPTEEVLAVIWAELLGVDGISIHDSFFELGGHSLSAIRMVNRVRQVFDVDLRIRSLFESPTVAGLAAVVDSNLRDASASQAPPIQPVARDRPLPLSFGQQRLWFLQQLEPESAAYCVPGALRLTGRLHLLALEQSFSELTRRHETLRTTFGQEHGEAVQYVHGMRPIELPVIDLECLGAVDRIAWTERLLTTEAVRPFDLGRGPLLRLLLIRDHDHEHLLFLNMHHIISDGWSAELLVRELASLYAGYVHAEPVVLPELPIQYADFACWQRDWLRGPALDSLLGYWRKQLAGAPEVIGLTTDRPHPVPQTDRGAVVRRELPATTSHALRQLSQQHAATLYMTLLCAFKICLGRYGAGKDIVVGTNIANRTQPEVEGLIGFLVNALVLRTRLTGEPSFREALARVRETVLGAFAHQDLPFDRLVEELQPRRDLSTTPVFQVLFDMIQVDTMQDFELPGLTIAPLAPSEGTAKFDLTMMADDTRDEIVLSVEYNTDLMDSTTLGRMLSHLEHLLVSVIEAPEGSISELSMLGAAESFEVLVEWNGELCSYPTEHTFQHLFRAQAEATPDRIAAVWDDHLVTFGELDHRARHLAALLLQIGLQRGDFVGVLKSRDGGFLVAILAILEAGGAYVPFEPTYPEERLSYMVTDSGISVLITEASWVESLPSVMSCSGQLQSLVCLDAVDLSLPTGPGVNLYGPEDVPITLVAGGSQRHGEASDPAYMLYTSGSTGMPKGAVIDHAGAVNHMYAQFEALQLDDELRFLQSAPSSSDISVWQLLAPLILGGRTVIVSLDTVSDPEVLARTMRDQRITLAELVPLVLRYLLDHLVASDSVGRTLPALRCLMASSEAVSVDLINGWLTLCPGLRLTNSYGPTEASDDILQLHVDELLSTSLPSVPVGRPMANCEVYLVDQAMQPVPIGVPGEICVGGIAVGSGYWRKPARTSKSYVPNKFARRPGDVLYRTGDLGRWLQDGHVELLGRIDHQVKIRGFRVELGEIETALREAPGVVECAVVVREDHEDKQLIAFLEVREGVEAGAGMLRDHLKQLLPGHMVPSAFSVLDTLPIAPSGKIDRILLGQRASAPLDQIGHILERPFTVPRTPTEEALVAIWSDVLSLERVGVETDFFELGGHSLLAIRVLARVRETLDVDIPVRQVFEYPTIAEFAGRVDRQRRSGAAGSQKPALRRIGRKTRRMTRKEEILKPA